MVELVVPATQGDPSAEVAGHDLAAGAADRLDPMQQPGAGDETTQHREGDRRRQAGEEALGDHRLHLAQFSIAQSNKQIVTLR